jgi:hypothetical protein
MISRKKKEKYALWFRYRNKDEHAEIVTINAKTTKKRPLYSLKSCVVKASVGRSPTEQKIRRCLETAKQAELRQRLFL